MAAVRSYLLTDQNRFRADTSKHWEEFICKVSKKKKKKCLTWFRRRCDNCENQRWLPVAIFVDGSEPVSGGHNKSTGETTQTSFGEKKNNNKKNKKKKNKKKKKRSRKRGDNKIFTIIGKGQSAILKMAAVRPYLLTDYNRFRGDTSRQWDEFTFRFWQNSSSVFGRRCDNGENQRWLWYFFFRTDEWTPDGPMWDKLHR